MNPLLELLDTFVTLVLGAEAQTRQARMEVSLSDVDRSDPRAIRFEGTSSQGVVRGRILPLRGWAFLISADVDPDGRSMLALLDEVLEPFNDAAYQPP